MVSDDDTSALRKARGAFFTPPTLARYIADWAVRSDRDKVLEPSCGDAVFLLSAAQRFRTLGAPSNVSGRLHGLDIHPASAKAAKERLVEDGASVDIVVADFFDRDAKMKRFDAVIGNPPYIRYQSFTGEHRAKSLRAALAAGVRLNGLASSWAAFTVHAASFLVDDGRLGLVLPAELLTVKYAAPVREFLLKRFAQVRVILFDERVFPGVSEEVVILLAEGSGGCKSFEVYQAQNLSDLERICTTLWTGHTISGQSKWTSALLTSSALHSYNRLCSSSFFTTMLGWGETYLGSVTGNNSWFSLSQEDVDRLGLKRSELTPISPPGSKHLLGLSFTSIGWEKLVKEGKKCYLFSPSTQPTREASAYINAGEKAGVQEAYKCRRRSPWWRIPMVKQPDILFTYMNHERPRLLTNDAGIQICNSLYGVKLFSGSCDLGRELLPLVALNSATLLGAEMVGRAYGGGMLKHEPNEADLLPIPTVTTLEAIAHDLRAIRPMVGKALRGTAPMRATEMIDEILLKRHLNLPHDDIRALRQARQHLFNRRISRGRSERVLD